MRKDRMAPNMGNQLYPHPWLGSDTGGCVSDFRRGRKGLASMDHGQWVGAMPPPKDLVLTTWWIRYKSDGRTLRPGHVDCH